MEVEKEVSITREKKEARLIEEYEEGLKDFEKRFFDQGVQKLRKLLQNKMIRDNDFRDLRYACFVSLGEVYEKELKMINESIHYLYKAITLKENDFKTWFKLAKLCKYQGYFSQSEKCFFMAQKYMPGTSYQNILYQSLTHISFLQENIQVFLQRVDYLIGNSFNKNHNLSLKAYMFNQIGQQQKANEIIDGYNLRSIMNSEVEQILIEKQDIKMRQKVNPLFQRLPVSLSKQNEFTIYIDKLTWQNFLKIVNIICKMFFCAKRGDNTFKKDKKLNNIYTIIKQNHNLLNTLIWIKEKREAPPTEADNWNLSKKQEKQPSNSGTNATNQSMIKEGKEMKDQSAQSSTSGGSKKKDAKTIQIIKTLQGGTKKSSRIKEFNKNQNQNIVNISIEQHILDVAEKNKFDIKRKLQNLNTEFYTKIEELNPEKATQQFNQIFKKLIVDEEQESQENIKKNQMEEELKMEQRELNQLKQAEDKEQKQILLDQYCNEDFMKFFTKIKHRPFINLIDLIEEILRYFLTNGNKNNQRDDIKEFVSEEYGEGLGSSKLFDYCPNLLLNNLDVNRMYKKEISKLLYKIFKNENNILLTAFELLLEEYNQIKQDKQDREITQKKREKLIQIKEILRWIQFEFLTSYDLRSSHGVEQIRIYHSLAVFYSDRDFESVQFANMTVQKLKDMITQLNLIPDQTEQPQNTENLDKKEDRKPKMKILLNFFWLNQKYLNSNFSEFIQDRIVENKFKKEIIKQNKKQMPYVEKDDEIIILDQDEGQQGSLKEHLEEFLQIFESRLNERGLDDANNLYYRNIFEILQNQKLEQSVFLDKLNKILTLYFDFHDSKITEYRKNTQQLDKLFKFENLCEEFLKRFSVNQINNQSRYMKNLILQTNMLFLKALIIKVFINVSQNEQQTMFVKLFASFVTCCLYLSDSDKKYQKISYISFLTHDLIQQLNSSLHQEIYKSWHEYQYFNILINQIFIYLNEREEVRRKEEEEEEKSQTDEELNKKPVEKIKQYAMVDESSYQNTESEGKQVQLYEKNKKKEGDVIEKNVKFDRSIECSQEEGKMISELQVKNKEQEMRNEETNLESQLKQDKIKQKMQKKTQSTESEDDEEDDFENDDIDDFLNDQYIFDVLKNIYRCFYGIKIRSNKKVTTVKYANISENNVCTFNNIEEIQLFIKFTKKSFPNYLTNLVCQLNTSYIFILIGAFDYIKKNDEKWALCPNLGQKKDEFQKYMKDKKVSSSNNIIEYLQQRSKQNQVNCFCDKVDCFAPVLQDDFLLNLFLLIGRALSQYNPSSEMQNDNSKPKFKTRRQSLKNAEKMFNFLILLKPSEFLGWYSLGDVFSGLSFMYFDASVFEPLNTKVVELKDIYLSAKRVYNYILENFISKKQINNRFLEEVKEDILILNIVKMYERKSIYLMSLNPVYNDYDYIRESIVKKQRVTSILDKIHTFEYDCSTPRMIILMEVFITRNHYQKYHSATFEQHFKNIKLIEDFETSDFQKNLKGRKNTKDVKENKAEEPLTFKGEYYDQEGQCEFSISIWKIFKRYLQLLKVIDGQCIQKDDTIQKMIQDICKKQKITNINEIMPIVLDDVEETISVLKKIEPKLLNPDVQNEIQVTNYFYDKDRLDLKINLAIKLSQIACSILTKRIVLELEVEDYQVRLRQAIEQIQLILNNNFNMFQQLTSKHNNKKLKYKRFVIRSFYYSSQMIHEINNNYDRASSHLGEIFNFKLDEIVNYYTHFENQPIEKDPKLSILYTKDLCFMIEKYKFVKLMSTLLRKQKDVEKMRSLNKKANKVMIQQYEDDSDKLNKIFKQLYLITLNDLLLLIDESLTSGNETIANLKKWIFDIYSMNIKTKQTYKYIENNSDMISKIKNVMIKGYCKFENIEQTQRENESFDNLYSKSVRCLEDQFKKKKPVTKTFLIATQKDPLLSDDNKLTEIIEDDTQLDETEIQEKKKSMEIES